MGFAPEAVAKGVAGKPFGCRLRRQPRKREQAIRPKPINPNAKRGIREVFRSAMGMAFSNGRLGVICSEHQDCRVEAASSLCGENEHERNFHPSRRIQRMHEWAVSATTRGPARARSRGPVQGIAKLPRESWNPWNRRCADPAIGTGLVLELAETQRP